jgi:hypothetical protein
MVKTKLLMVLTLLLSLAVAYAEGGGPTGW